MAEYIEREALLNRFSDKGPVGRSVRDYIKDQPAADVAPVVRGRWDIRVDDFDCEYAKCSECGEEFYDANDDTIDIIFNYCPNCGARMDGE